jgi:hypothetical protein
LPETKREPANAVTSFRFINESEEKPVDPVVSISCGLIEYCIGSATVKVAACEKYLDEIMTVKRQEVEDFINQLGWKC